MSAAPEKSAAELLATPVQFLKGVGPQRAMLFEKLGLATAADVLFYFPRSYQDLTQLQRIDELEEDQLVSIRGTIEEIDVRNSGPGRSMLGVLVRQGDDYLRALWFNQPFMQHRFEQGQEVLLSGKVRNRGMRWEMTHPNAQTLDEDAEDDELTGEVLPIYPLTEGLSQYHVRRLVQAVLEDCADVVDEVFPESYRQQHDLWTISQALREIHFPTDMESSEKARYRFIYQELLVLQLALSMRRERLALESHATPLPVSAKIDARICRRFPFDLTEGQRQVIDEVCADMALEHPMNRLLQGDVGSGKTVVALYATLLAIAHGQQVAIMAPTEVLARQHAVVLGQFLEASHVRTGMLSGSLSGREREKMLDAIAAHDVDVVIGTHAIVESGAKFDELGLVVIDEQHKFGVRQRAKLRQQGDDTHYLVMTATPIPRTIAMSLFGDLDVSTLRDSPPGRQKIHTYLASEEQRAKWWEFFRKKLREGRQGFVITPLVEESENWQVANLNQAYEELANGELEAFRLGTIHGRMSASEKDAAMKDFHSGRTQVLVSTTVVEVGVDVPNATLMAIEGAERFGLAQLHQLRGRISRGSQPGYCCLFADPTSDESRERLESFVGTTDGFELAEIDFKIRGPGELLGTKQHGLPPLRIADLLRDGKILELVRGDAQQLVADDPGLASEPHARLRRMVLVRYGKVLELGDVG